MVSKLLTTHLRKQKRIYNLTSLGNGENHSREINSSIIGHVQKSNNSLT